MAKLSDIAFAHDGEQATAVADVNLMMKIQDDAPVPTQAAFKIFKLVNKKKGRYFIDGRNDVINPKTGRQERIWLLSGAGSIWSTELVELLKDKNYVNNNLISLEFQDGIMRVGLHEINKLEFIKHCTHLISDPSKRDQTTSRHPFFEYDPEKQQKAALEKEMLEIEMVRKAAEQPEDKMRKHASFLGVIFSDELGMPKTPDGIRTEYMLRAKRNPVHFRDTMDSKEIDIQWMVKKAILEAKLDLGKEGNSIYWTNGGFVTKLPTGRKPLEYLTELALTNSDQGKSFLEQLQGKAK